MFWVGKSKKIMTEIKNKSVKVRLSPVEILILTQLRARQIRNKISGNPEDTNVGQYGYEMIQDLNQLFSGAWKAKSGTIYPMLNRLETEKNLIKGDRKKSPLGPVKKVYNLTLAGKSAIDGLIAETFEQNIDFMLNYIDLLIPFIQNIEETDPDVAEDIFQKIMTVPTKFFNLALEQSFTEFDREIKDKKLKQMRLNLLTVVRNIEDELKKSEI